MNSIRQKIFDVMESMNVPYDVVEHQPVYTIEEMEAIEELNKNSKDLVVKNLFIRDDKKQRFFPVSYTHLDVYKRQVRTWVTKMVQEIGYTPLQLSLIHI